jgi:UDP-2-acetamido-2-deoxy-ribo-hexuluronate aminotransferase
MEFINLKAQYARIKNDVNDRIQQVLEHGKYILGPEVDEVEAKLATFVGTKHCITVASGTDALLIALLALNIKPGDEVITTPFSFIATAEVIALLGAKIVFVDIDPRSYNIVPTQIEAAITAKTRAIIPVSLYGQCADFDAINAIANKYNIPVIEDGAQSFGATYKQQLSCSLTTIGCTSFFPSKPLACYGDGGACFTNDDNIAKIMREIRIHGQDRRYHHPRLGINGRFDTIQAAILLAKLAIFPEEVQLRAAIGQKYSEVLRKYVTMPFIEPYNTSVYAQYTIEVTNRDEFQLQMQKAGVPTAVHYPVPLHKQPVFSENAAVSLPIAETKAQSVISLPMHPYLTAEEIEIVVNAVIGC